MSCSDKCNVKLSKPTGAMVPGDDCVPPETLIIPPVDSPANCDYDDEKYLLTMGIDTKAVPPPNIQNATGLGTNIGMYFPYSVFRVV